MAGRKRKEGEPSRRDALTTLIRYAAERVSPDAANGVQVVRREDRDAVRQAVTRLFEEAHGEPMRTRHYEIHQLDDRRTDEEVEADDGEGADREMFLAKTGFQRMAQIGTFTLYELTHSEGGGNGITLNASIITWQRDMYEPKRWFAELYVHNTLKEDRNRQMSESEYRYPWDDRLKLAEELRARVEKYAAREAEDYHWSRSGTYAEGTTETEALQNLQSLLERTRLALFHHHTGNNGRL